MRELGRLLLVLRQTTGVKKFIDILKPDYFDNIVDATKTISGYDAINKTFKASSLALHMRTRLKQICDIATKLIIKKNRLLPCDDQETTLKNIKSRLPSRPCEPIPSPRSWSATQTRITEWKATPTNYLFGSCTHRLPQDVYETAKVSKLLLAINNGKGALYKGKTLDEIEFSDNVQSDDSDEESQPTSSNITANRKKTKEEFTTEDASEDVKAAPTKERQKKTKDVKEDFNEDFSSESDSDSDIESDSESETGNNNNNLSSKTFTVNV
ncbi:hypothetical protein NQ315_011187 [Exocentrus adspersus]|uniref:Uncharacterized protein n=1 Tax=Exocentrus adspersus TaxID=1586481 RepID=A0AAV8V960_9CUCU|nr:hypothetical protein NQ315_011187 [Exocentrus adspersus]